MTKWIAGAMTLALVLAGCGETETSPSNAQEEISAEQVVGKWESDWSDESVIVIYKDGEDHRMRENFEDGSELDSLLEQSNVAGETRYIADYGRDLGEYYVIGPTGWLQFWSKNGKFYSAPPLE
ncbi:hypothetical protein [Vreelandella venusta]|uniref:hypothetical protein n=1 Tax=Vreelandella venusta TaxID=44935 RepID=UPI00200F145B|nr:hypothetical protein [Halomonas venusta]UQI38782.1 hypothetical protein M3L73_11085 [Halomonas venusta]